MRMRVYTELPHTNHCMRRSRFAGGFEMWLRRRVIKSGVE